MFQFLQKHAIFIETATLKEMPDALSSPFPEFFYIQTKVSHVQVSGFNNFLNNLQLCYKVGPVH